MRTPGEIRSAFENYPAGKSKSMKKSQNCQLSITKGKTGEGDWLGLVTSLEIFTIHKLGFRATLAHDSRMWLTEDDAMRAAEIITKEGENTCTVITEKGDILTGK